MVRHQHGVKFALATAVAAVVIGCIQFDGRVHAAVGDPINATRFVLVANGVQLATFTELIGIASEIETTEYYATSDKDVVLKKLPGKRKPPTVTLRGVFDDNATLFAWHQAVAEQGFAAARQNVTLVMFDGNSPVVRYFLRNAFPSKVEIEGLKAGTSQRLLQTVTLVAESITRGGS